MSVSELRIGVSGQTINPLDIRFIDISLVREPVDPNARIHSSIAGGESLKYEAQLEMKLRKTENKPRHYRNRFEMLEL